MLRRLDTLTLALCMAMIDESLLKGGLFSRCNPPAVESYESCSGKGRRRVPSADLQLLCHKLLHLRSSSFGPIAATSSCSFRATAVGNNQQLSVIYTLQKRIWNPNRDVLWIGCCCTDSRRVSPASLRISSSMEMVVVVKTYLHNMMFYKWCTPKTASVLLKMMIHGYFGDTVHGHPHKQ